MKGTQLNELRKITGATMLEICSSLGVTPTKWSKLIAIDDVPPQIEMCTKFLHKLPGNEFVREFIERMHKEYEFTYSEISEMLCLHHSAASRIAKGGNASLSTRQLVRNLARDIQDINDAKYWLATAREIKQRA